MKFMHFYRRNSSLRMYTREKINLKIDNFNKKMLDQRHSDILSVNEFSKNPLCLWEIALDPLI